MTRVAQPHAGHPVVALDLGDLGVGQERDLVVGLGALEHDPRGAELVAAVDERDAAGEPGQEGGLLHRGVAAADHGDVLVTEEEPVAGGTGAHAHADQLFLAGHAEVPGRGAHREDDGARAVRLVADGDRLDGPVQRHRVDVLHPQVGAEPQRLLAHLVHQLRVR